jgi:hypothetical protein
MRIRSLLPLIGLVVVGCVVKEYDGPPPASGGTPTTGGTPAATTAPPSGTVAGGTVTPATPTGTVAPATTSTVGVVPPTTTGTVVPSGAVKPVTGIAGAEMTKANTFGQPKPFAGAIAGTVYAIPVGTSALPTNWSTLGAPITTLYSQAWNVPPHDFKEGFPGVPGDRVEWFAIRWEGTIHVTNGGVYHFKLNSDDGAKLTIDSVLVVNDDGTHPPKIAEGNTTLNAGNHTLVLEYFQGPKWQIALQAWVSGTSVPEHILTTSF